MLELLVAIALQANSPAPEPPCLYDREAILALDQEAFDQNMSGGWRTLNNAGCDVQGADLIRDWRTAHKVADGILYWHEGQLRANAGQNEQAIALFERARKRQKQDALGWNLYVDGSIAFLRRDRHALEAARAKLAALPKPTAFNPVGPDGKPMEIPWPVNLNVLNGFLKCWHRPYKQAYGCATTFKVEAN